MAMLLYYSILLIFIVFFFLLSYVYRSAKFDAKLFNFFARACLFYFTVHLCTKLFGPKVK